MRVCSSLSTLCQQGWKGLFCGDGGWLAAAKAINAIGEFLRQEGVKFGFGGYVLGIGQRSQSRLFC